MTEKSSVPDDDVRERIRLITRDILYAVLCTQGQGQPYGSLVAYAIGDDLRALVFCTPTTTRKYRLLSDCDRVALVIDNRTQNQDDVMKVEGLTATGHATELCIGEEFQLWRNLLLDRHPYMKSFIASPTCAMIKVDVVRYFHVRRFQEVYEWVPQTNG